MAKKELVKVNGKELTAKQKLVYDFVQSHGEVIPTEVAGKDPFKDLTVASVRATLASLDKTKGLIQSQKKLIGEKLVTVYSKKVSE